jgi:uncharacterized protein (TIGR03083 family)
MKITPRYDAPCITVDTDLDELRAATLRQRRRAVAAFSALTDEQWVAQSRCDRWAARDVVAHLIDTDRFWDASLTAGLSGTPTRILDGFDPARTPADLAAAFADVSNEEILTRYAEVAASLCSTIESLDDAGWQTLAEAPPGHVPAAVVVHHALWDSWVHERDVFLPLWLDVPIEQDEVVAALAYAIALGPAFTLGSGRTGTLVVEVIDADVEIVVEVDDSVRVTRGPRGSGADLPRLRGDAVALAEMFSIRSPFVGDLGDDAWLVAGLADVFDQRVGS